MVSYKDRLAEALRSAGVSDTQLAKHLKITIQAVRKVAAGTSAAFTAENNSKAARYLGVSPDWLATGEGEMQSTMDWPLKTLSYAEFVALPEEFHAAVENFAQPYVKSSQTLMRVGNVRQENVSTGEQKGVVFVNHQVREQVDGTSHSAQDERAKPAARKSAGNR